MNRIDISKLKVFASKKLLRGSIFHDLLLSEADELESGEFLGKVDVWLKLLTLGVGRIISTERGQLNERG